MAASASILEKDVAHFEPVPLPPTTPSKPPGGFFSYFNPVSPFSDVYDRFSQWRTDLGLPHPGTVEGLQKEVKATHLVNYMFDGARADLTKSLSMNPLFQVTHSFQLGSQNGPSSYNFGAVYATQQIFMQGGVDHDGSVNGRFNWGWGSGGVTKFQSQLSAQSNQNMIQVEHDYQGQDFSANAKAINPWPSDMTGVFVGNYLQSVTKSLALGVEAIYQRQSPEMTDLSASYLAKWTGREKNWIATAQLQGVGLLQATYWQKLSEKVEVAADLQLVAVPQRRDAVATLGAKYDLRLSTFRAQLDSTGKVSALLEQRFTPTFAFLVSGEIDHFKNAAKVGVGVMIESSTLTPEEMGLVPQAI